MKRVMVLLLVLGTGPAAKAGLMLNPSGLVMMGEPLPVVVEATGLITGFEFKVEVMGGILSGEPVFPETWMFAPYVKSRSDTYIDVTGGDFFPKAGPLTVMSGLTITWHDVGLVRLVATGANNVDGEVVPAGTVMDMVFVPEPMGLMLLGAGGLYLRRRRRRGLGARRTIVKRVLVLILICGMGAFAEGGLFLTVNGEDVGDTTELRSFELGVDSDGPIVGFELIIEVDAGSIDISGITFPETWMFAPYVRSSSSQHLEVTGGDFLPKTGPLTVVRGIQFDLGSDAEALIVLDHIVTDGIHPAVWLGDDLHVVPEPGSVVLFGLCGLFLRRRSQAV